MGLLENPGSNVKGVLDPIANLIASPFKKKVDIGRDKSDFQGGFQIIEIIAGVEQKASMVQLIGNMMPMQPFGYGGSQRIKKDYYPGHSEPTFQIFGSEEANTTLKGTLKDKKYKDKALLGASEEVAKSIDGIRIRGNLCRFQMGEWRRFGFIEKTNFELKTRKWIDYTIELSIIGFNPPLGCKLVTEPKNAPDAINRALIDAALAFQNKTPNVEIPVSIADLINGLISDVAGAINAVTNFVDKIITTGENIVASANRAVGLVKNARANISRFQRRIGAISYNVSTLGKGLTTAKKVTGNTKSISYISGQIVATQNLETLLARLQKQFEANSITVPLRRYKIAPGDTLQKISIKFYGNSDDWKRIYDHNKMTTTLLSPGKVIEIPKK